MIDLVPSMCTTAHDRWMYSCARYDEAQGSDGWIRSPMEISGNRYYEN
jgi:hypothetical protein